MFEFLLNVILVPVQTRSEPVGSDDVAKVVLVEGLPLKDYITTVLFSVQLLH